MDFSFSFFLCFNHKCQVRICFILGRRRETPPSNHRQNMVRSVSFPPALASRAGCRLPSSSVTQAIGHSPLPLGSWPRAPHSNVFPASHPQAPFLRECSFPSWAISFYSSWTEMAGGERLLAGHSAGVAVIRHLLLSWVIGWALS